MQSLLRRTRPPAWLPIQNMLRGSRVKSGRSCTHGIGQAVRAVGIHLSAALGGTDTLQRSIKAKKLNAEGDFWRRETPEDRSLTSRVFQAPPPSVTWADNAASRFESEYRLSWSGFRQTTDDGGCSILKFLIFFTCHQAVQAHARARRTAARQFVGRHVRCLHGVPALLNFRGG